MIPTDRDRQNISRASGAANSNKLKRYVLWPVGHLQPLNSPTED